MATNPISQAQLEANRSNAQLSTGPTSQEGKSISSQNAVKHGFTGKAILRDPEERLAYAVKAKTFIATWKPIGDQEEELVDLIHDAHWQMKRIRAAQEDLRAGVQSSNCPETMQRYLTRHTNLYFRSIAMLIRLQNIRRKEEKAAAQKKVETEYKLVYNPRMHGILIPPDGFVLQDSPLYRYFDQQSQIPPPATM